MNKRIYAGLFIVLLFVAGIQINSIRAQKETEEFYDDKTLINIEKKLDELSMASKENKEILRKLDQVLSNQERILAELDVVKIRATRK